jgi:hypothetical protein
MTSATSATTTTSTTLIPPVPKPAEYTTADLVLTFFKEKFKDLAKTGSYIAFWATQAMPDLPKNVTQFNTTLRDFKNFVSMTELPQKVYELGTSIQKAAAATAEKVGSASREVFKNSMSLINTVGDSIDFVHVFVPISKEVMRWVSGINFAATIGFAGNGVIEQVQHIQGTKAEDSKKKIFHMINIARDVSYLVLGIIGLGFILTATPMIPWMIVACLTSGLALSIGSYFYEKIYDPENKGKNLNPAIVIENQVNQRNYERARSAAI